MFEVSESGHYHGHAALVAEVYALVVPYRAARLDDCLYAVGKSYFHAVLEREECVRSHYCSVCIKSKTVCLFNGLLEGIYPGGLSHSAAYELAVLDKDYGVGLGVLYQFVGHQQVFSLVFFRGLGGAYGKVCLCQLLRFSKKFKIKFIIQFPIKLQQR